MLESRSHHHSKLSSTSPPPSSIGVGDADVQVRDRQRASSLQVIYQIFEEEVEFLCGKRYSPVTPGMPRRAGSDKGAIFMDGQKITVRKPRVKRDGKEFHLASYRQLSSGETIFPDIEKAMLSGVSMRDYKKSLSSMSERKGFSPSFVSAAFQKISRKSLDEMNSRDLSASDVVVMIMDGLHFGEKSIVSALGINITGHQIVLGMREGDSEDTGAVKDFLASLVARGLQEDRLALIVIDGGEALRSAITACWKDRVAVQRCMVHTERSILGDLAKEHHMEFCRRWKMLHDVVDYEQALELHEELRTWLSEINLAAMQSLEAAHRETLTVIRLQASTLLRSTLSSTNTIESFYSRVKEFTKRVKNWDGGEDQLSRWVSFAMMDAEKSFRRIRGFRDVPFL